MNCRDNGCMNREWVAIIACSLLLLVSAVRADSLTIDNVALVPGSAEESFIQFDIAWSNSWRTVLEADGAGHENWDAAWVFVKFRVPKDQAPWRHAVLATDGHQVPAGAMLSVGTSEGADGAAFGEAGAGVYSLPTERVEDANAVGAGDTFNAALLHSLNRGTTLDKAAETAIQLATAAVKRGKGVLGALA